MGNTGNAPSTILSAVQPQSSYLPQTQQFNNGASFSAPASFAPSSSYGAPAAPPLDSYGAPAAPVIAPAGCGETCKQVPRQSCQKKPVQKYTHRKTGHKSSPEERLQGRTSHKVQKCPTH